MSTCPHLSCDDRDTCARCGQATCPTEGYIADCCGQLLCGCGRCPDCGVAA